MRKTSVCEIVDPPPSASLGRRIDWRRLIFVFLASPLIFEASQVVLARWARLSGRNLFVKTPILNALVALRGRIHHALDGYVLTGGWNPEVVVPIAAALFLLTARFLRAK